MSPRPRPEILQIDAYVGGVSKLQGVNRVIKLSSNEGAFGAPPGPALPTRARLRSCIAIPMAALTNCAARWAQSSAWTPPRSSAAPGRTI
jgi:hypothetical protein